jgi:hypothetical protein
VDNPSIAATVALGLGTVLVYQTLLAVVTDWAIAETTEVPRAAAQTDVAGEWRGSRNQRLIQLSDDVLGTPYQSST